VTGFSQQQKNTLTTITATDARIDLQALHLEFPTLVFCPLIEITGAILDREKNLTK